VGGAGHPDADVHAALDLAGSHLGDARIVVLRDPDTPSALLVRPDAHVAAPADVASLRRWFGAAGLTVRQTADTSPTPQRS
jgi:hypothetical protein